MKQTNGARRPLGTRCLCWSPIPCISLAAPSLRPPGGVRYLTRPLLSPYNHQRHHPHLSCNLHECFIGGGGGRLNRPMGGWMTACFREYAPPDPY
uniref:Secreted protein n=1 Tax=Plectus sambesii TaxID=2011161 RepID=A0A914WX12_9BILA